MFPGPLCGRSNKSRIEECDCCSANTLLMGHPLPTNPSPRIIRYQIAEINHGGCQKCFEYPSILDLLRKQNGSDDAAMFTHRGSYWFRCRDLFRYVLLNHANRKSVFVHFGINPRMMGPSDWDVESCADAGEGDLLGTIGTCNFFRTKKTVTRIRIGGVISFGYLLAPAFYYRHDATRGFFSPVSFLMARRELYQHTPTLRYP